MASQFQLYRDAKNEWRWRLLAENHEPIAASSEGYVAKADALNGIDIVRTKRAEVAFYEDRSGEWRWRLVHANGNIIATSGESYVRRWDCEYGYSVVEKLAPDAPLKEIHGF